LPQDTIVATSAASRLCGYLNKVAPRITLSDRSLPVTINQTPYGGPRLIVTLRANDLNGILKVTQQQVFDQCLVSLPFVRSLTVPILAAVFPAREPEPIREPHQVDHEVPEHGIQELDTPPTVSGSRIVLERVEESCQRMDSVPVFGRAPWFELSELACKSAVFVVCTHDRCS
jgi:hypothetical protein